MIGSDPRFLWLIAAVIPYGILEYFWIRRLATFGGSVRNGYVIRRACSAVAGALFWISASIACAGGVSRTRYVPEHVADAVISIVIDVSNSMLADDGDGTRLTRAVSFVRGLAATAPAARWRLIAFKGSSVTLCPATYDAAAFDAALSWVGPGLMDAPGSDAGRAFAEILRLSDDSSLHIAIVLSDGNDTGEQAHAAALRLAAANIGTFFIGVGGDQPIEIFDTDGSRVLDARGEQVQLALDERAMEDWARASRGNYLKLDDPGAFSAVAAVLDKAASSIGTVRNVPRTVDGVPEFSLLALAFLTVAAILAMSPRAPGAKEPHRGLRPQPGKRIAVRKIGRAR